jgi:endonuclease/exonuclease/phosphatase family metal-dependent hydrolase
VTRRILRPLTTLGVAGLIGLPIALTATSAPAAAAATVTPTKVNAAAGHLGTAVFWDGHGDQNFQIEQADDPGMTTDVVNYTIHDGYDQFTPYGLTKGQTYYFAVRAGSGSSASAYSSVVSATPTTLEQPARVMTYNILEHSADGKFEGDSDIAQWSVRRPGVAKLIRAAKPDFVAIEEASDWIGPVSHRVRQIDSLRNEVGSPYRIAKTEPRYPAHGWFRTGDYILYNSDTFEAVGAHGYFKIGQLKYGVYQELKNRASGAKLLFVATHTLPGSGHANEVTREKEVKTLFSKGHAIAKRLGLPSLYAGDFNSAAPFNDANFTIDSAGTPAKQRSYDDAFFTAQSHVNGTFDSANQYLRRAPHASARIDRIFTPPGVSTKDAGLIVDLTNGRFVGTIPSDHNPLYADIYYPY